MKIVLQIILFSILFIPTVNFGQDIDIVPYLKQIESGEINVVKEKLPELKLKHPGNPAVMFLDGVLTEDGQQAVAIYQNIIDKYPNSDYADASVYRVFSYFYALGLYEAAEKMRNKLYTEYPDSPYGKLAESNKIPKFDSPQVTQQQDVKPDQTIPEPIQSGADYKFTIQAGAFSNTENAVNLKNDFEKAGYVTEIKEKTVGGTIFQVVYVGKFIGRTEAEDFLNIINSKYGLNGRIVEITH